MRVTAKRLRDLLDYDPVTGIFRNAVSRSGASMGAEAGSIEQGYRRICIDGRRYFAQNLAWLYVHGEWPENLIDHIDRNPLNNAIGNLRPATTQQNHWNRRAQKNNRSGLKGVNFEDGRYRANIVVNRKKVHLGTFDSAEKAHAAYCKAAVSLRGEFARFA